MSDRGSIVLTTVGPPRARDAKNKKRGGFKFVCQLSFGSRQIPTIPDSGSETSSKKYSKVLKSSHNATGGWNTDDRAGRNFPRRGQKRTFPDMTTKARRENSAGADKRRHQVSSRTTKRRASGKSTPPRCESNVTITSCGARARFS